MEDGIEHMMNDPGSGQTFWSALLTAFVGLLFWNGKQVVATLKEKADLRALDEYKADVNLRLAQMLVSIDRMVDAQAEQHAQNTERLDKILSEVYKSRGFK
jgi:hypothetical protein